jgi:hypothetical protein
LRIITLLFLSHFLILSCHLPPHIHSRSKTPDFNSAWPSLDNHVTLTFIVSIQ